MYIPALRHAASHPITISYVLLSFSLREQPLIFDYLVKEDTFGVCLNRQNVGLFTRDYIHSMYD